MTLREFVDPLLTIAACLLACLAARAESMLFWRAGYNNELTAIYCDCQAAFALASDNLFNVTSSPIFVTGLGTFTPDSEPLAQAALALPFKFSGARVTSLSNLSLPVGAYWPSARATGFSRPP